MNTRRALRRIAIAAERVLQVDRVSQALSHIEHRASVAKVAAEPVAGAAWRELVSLGLHLAGASLATAGVLTRSARLPATVPAFVGAVVNVPQLREALNATLGPHRAERVLAVGDAGLAVVSGQPASELVNTVHGLLRWTEARARQRAWQRRARALLTDTGQAQYEGRTRRGAGTHPSDHPRPVPLPPGPVERYAAQGATAGVAGLVGGWVAARPELRVAALAGASAKAARLTKESWACRVARTTADRDVVILDPRVFRRFDRLDTVVIEADLLVSGGWSVDEIVTLRPQADPGQLFGPALRLLENGTVGSPDPDGWELRSPGPADEPLHRELARRAIPAARPLTLCRHGEPVAAVAAAPQLDPYAEAVIAAAHRVGGVYVAGEVDGLEQRLSIDGVLPGDDRLAEQVRDLQRSGHGVLLVARHGQPGLRAADSAVAVACSDGQQPPYGDLICQPADVATLLAAVPTARRAARAGVLVAGYGAAAGALVGLTSPGAQRASQAVGLATNLAALAGIAVGVWYADPVVRQRPPVPVNREPWHAVPVPEVLRRLRSSLDGLSGEEASRRSREAERRTPPEGIGRHTLHELENPLTPALAAGAGLAAASGSMLDSVLIGAVVAVNALLGGVQRWGAARALANLAEQTTVPLRLRRDCRTVKASIDDLVHGDIVELRSGDTVPADCRILQSEGLEVDEAALTGESLPVAKTAEPSVGRQPVDRTSMVYQGTAVAAGRAVAAVVAAGENTEVHRMQEYAPASPSSGVQERLQKLTDASVPLSLAGAVTLVATNLLRGRPVRESVAPGVSLAVAAVPEGLPSVATVAQLSAAYRLSRRGVLVRNPAALESLGRLQVLCFDKTGTLTEGRLRLRLVTDGSQQEPVEALPDGLRGVLAAALRASPRPVEGRPLPHPTDQAVVAGGREAGVTETDGRPGWARVEELPFEPSRGFHAVLGRDSDEYLLSVKGAPEVVLARCATRLVDGATEQLTESARADLARTATGLARRGYRVLAVAEGARPSAEELESEEDLTDLRFLGFVALADRARAAAARAVETLRRAGVRVVMVTGDHPSTAEAVASELDVLDNGQVMTGAELDRRSDAELITQLPRVTVFARVDPGHKARIVRLLREAGEVVAVTGDGANDAPAIRTADVGLALGSRATAAARHAADVVVTDNRIETVVDAVVEGRLLWTSVRQAVAVLLGGNAGEVAVTVGSGLLGGRTFGPRQLLLVNLLTDVAPAMALAARPPRGVTEADLLAEGPAASLGKALDRDLRVRAVATAGAAGAAWCAARLTGTAARATTVALVALVSAQLGQTALAARGDPLVTAACLASFGLLLSAVQVPGLSHLLSCRPLGPVGWSIALGAAATATVGAQYYQRMRREHTGGGDEPDDGGGGLPDGAKGMQPVPLRERGEAA